MKHARRAKTTLGKWLLAISVFILLIIIPEIVLRLVGFQYISGVSYGMLSPQQKILFEPDDDLFWKYPSSMAGVNSLGFRDREVTRPKGAHLKRLLFLGDSCTDQDFAKSVQSLLNSNYGSDALHYECVVLAAPGYSSYQGKVLARKYGKVLEADFVFVLFGWNDHWLTSGYTDEVSGASASRKVWDRIFYHSRLLQAGIKMAHFFSGHKKGNVSREVRVPPEQYRENLGTIDSIFAGLGVPVVFMTAPTTHPSQGVPGYLIESQLAPDTEFVISKHTEYNNIVRAVAKGRNAYLLDLDREFNETEQPGRLFMSDGIHFSQTGLEFVADKIFQFLGQKTELKVAP